ncbi:putative membrane protein [Escherichia coli 2-474-04_S1_C1]|nr:putative membrane protein [Escherichia coli 2-474-04_S1_C1]
MNMMISYQELVRTFLSTLGSNGSIFITFFGLCRTTKHS